jgi:hypothetical protein
MPACIDHNHAMSVIPKGLANLALDRFTTFSTRRPDSCTVTALRNDAVDF